MPFGRIWSGDREAEGGSLLRSYIPKGYRGFESPLLRAETTSSFSVPHRIGVNNFEIVAQLDRASDCGSGGRRFDSSQSHRIKSYNSHCMIFFGLIDISLVASLL